MKIYELNINDKFTAKLSEKEIFTGMYLGMDGAYAKARNENGEIVNLYCGTEVEKITE